MSLQMKTIIDPYLSIHFDIKFNFFSEIAKYFKSLVFVPSFNAKKYKINDPIVEPNPPIMPNNTNSTKLNSFWNAM